MTCAVASSRGRAPERAGGTGMRLATSGMLLVAVALLTSTGGCGGGGGGDPRNCGGVEDCGNLARCLGATCVEDAAPVAVLAVPDAIEALALAEFDGSASSDPDSPLGDRIAAFHWTFTSLDDACAGPTVSGTDARARVRFACPGAFRVGLVVVDELGKESSASADVTVAPHPESPTVVASPDRSVNHVCSGTPRVCTTEGTAPAVIAHLADGIEPVGTVVYHWAVDPPQSGPLDAHKRVTFLPSAAAASPSVRIEVDEAAVAAIVDDWVLRVTATDDAGPLGEATTRISVKNRGPALAAATPSVTVDHTYSGALYRASADTSRWQDPDGDPLTPVGSTGSAICASVTFKADGTAVVQCTRAFTGIPALTGFVTTHTVTVLASDPWVAAPSASATAITIGNRAATAASSTVNATGGPPCSEGACCRSEPEPPRTCLDYRLTCDSYVAHPHPSLADPDGDPVSLTWAWTGGGNGASVCEPSACAAELPVPSYIGCGSPPPTTVVGTFTVTDGGGSSSTGTLTVTE